MMKNRDFTYILGRVDELCHIYKNQMPKADKTNEFIKEIIRQLFKNEIEIISQYS